MKTAAAKKCIQFNPLQKVRNCFTALIMNGKERVLTRTLKLEKGTFLPDILEENNTREVQIRYNTSTNSSTLQYNTSTKRRQTVNLLDLIWRNTSLLVFAEYSEQDGVDLTAIAVQWILICFNWILKFINDSFLTQSHTI